MGKIEYELYEVGGHVRDSLLGVKSKDIDYAVVVNNDGGMVCNPDCYPVEIYSDPIDAFNDFVEDIKGKGYNVFLETPECLTVRAKFPNSNEVADFVLARQETYPNADSRRAKAELGTLEDDLLRRDFTLNAIARDAEGNLIDPFNGISDLRDRILRTPLDTFKSFNDDPLRVIRALRFHTTRGFDFSDEILRAFYYYPVNRLGLVSEERIREELHKCFKHDTSKTLDILFKLSQQGFKLREYIFDNNNLWLEPTNKK